MDEDQTAPPPVDEQAWDDVLTISQALTRLARIDFAAISDVDGLAFAAEEVVRKMPLLSQGIAREIRDRGLHGDRGARSIESYLRSVLRIDPGEAKAPSPWSTPCTPGPNPPVRCCRRSTRPPPKRSRPGRSPPATRW